MGGFPACLNFLIGRALPLIVIEELVETRSQEKKMASLTSRKRAKSTNALSLPVGIRFGLDKDFTEESLRKSIRYFTSSANFGREVGILLSSLFHS